MEDTLGPLGPLLQSGVLVVLQSVQTLTGGLLLLLYEQLLKLWSPSNDVVELYDPCFCWWWWWWSSTLLLLWPVVVEFFILCIILIFEDIHLAAGILFSCFSLLFFHRVSFNLLFPPSFPCKSSSYDPAWFSSYTIKSCYFHDYESSVQPMLSYWRNESRLLKKKVVYKI